MPAPRRDTPQALKPEPAEISQQQPFREFLESSLRTRSGAFQFAGHRALEAVADALADPDIPRVDILKATQIGLTTLAGFGYGLWEVSRGHNVGYFLPTDSMCREILGHRLRHSLSDDLAEALSITLQDGTASLGESRAYFRGLTSVTGAISVSLDVNLYDEVDDLDIDHFMLARQRLDGSHYAREVSFACGRHPGEAMDARFAEGTQHHRHLRCPACGADDQIPEMLFPKNVRQVDDTWRVVCVRCGGPLDVEDDARWVAHYEDRADIGVSFRVSALSIPWVSLDRLMREWHAALRQRRLMAPFRCSKLALPDAADRQAVTAEDLARATGSHAAPISPVPKAPAFVGIDTGDICHVAVAQVIGADKIGYVEFDALIGEALLERVRDIARRYDVVGILIDQRPEGALARSVCREYPGISYLQRFSASEGEMLKFQVNAEYRVLSFDREDTLGEWCDLVKRGTAEIALPATVDGRTFAQSDVARHILAGAQRMESTDSVGQTVYRFRSGAVENHYFMACAFAWRIAEHLYSRRVDARDVGLLGERSHAPAGAEITR